MLTEYKKKANTAIGLAIVTFVVAILIYSLSESQIVAAVAYVPMTFVGPLWILGCWCYAKGKGYHGAWGLLGLLTIIGIIILVCFPDRHKSTKESQKTTKNNN